MDAISGFVTFLSGISISFFVLQAVIKRIDERRREILVSIIMRLPWEFIFLMIIIC
jgi:hypothetical protein